MKRPRVVALDTMAVIWGITDATRIAAGQAKPGEDEPARRARLLIEDLERERASIIISTVSVAEVLAGIPEIDHANVIAALQGHFEVIPYGVDAARLAARMYRKHFVDRPKGPGGRDVIKNDLDVIATAKVFGAGSFYTHDDQARAIAKEIGLDARNLPTHSPYFRFPEDPPASGAPVQRDG